MTHSERHDEAIARLFTDSWEDDNGCWNFAGSVTSGGYGQLCIGNRLSGTHRWSWRLLHGAIPEGLFICHRCDNRRCIRPSHLFLGTVTDNNRDMVAKGRNRNQNMGRSHCRRGHEFVPGSYYIRPDTGSRCCLVCDRLKSKAKYRGERVPSVWEKSNA